MCTIFTMYMCVASRCFSLRGYPFNSYDFFDTWGRGEGETSSRRVVLDQCAVGLRDIKNLDPSTTLNFKNSLGWQMCVDYGINLKYKEFSLLFDGMFHGF